jgi:tRNA pseudouridine65 synthase
MSYFILFLWQLALFVTAIGIPTKVPGDSRVSVAFDRIPILRYEDNWVCVQKPPGISVHATSAAGRRRNERTLCSLVRKQLGRKVYPVHRLDHRTSGAILLAFDATTCGILHGQLKRSTKEYVALVRGQWKYNTTSVTIDVPLKVNSTLKDAITEFSFVASSDYNNLPYTLLLCRPLTGRTHQIRRHAYHLGHPILGDSEHGDSRVNRQWRTERGLNRLALHCLSIQLMDSSDACLAPIPMDLRCVLMADIQLWDTASRKEPRLNLEAIDERGGSFGRNYKKRQMDNEETQ